MPVGRCRAGEPLTHCTKASNAWGTPLFLGVDQQGGKGCQAGNDASIYITCKGGSTSNHKQVSCNQAPPAQKCEYLGSEVNISKQSGTFKAGTNWYLKGKDKGFRIGGDFFKQGIYAHAPSDADFNLDGKYKTLSICGGIEDGDGNCGDGVVMRVSLDGKPRWQAIKYSSEKVTCTKLDVQGVKTLSLHMNDRTGSRGCDESCWVNPVVCKVAGAGTCGALFDRKPVEKQTALTKVYVGSNQWYTDYPSRGDSDSITSRFFMGGSGSLLCDAGSQDQFIKTKGYASETGEVRFEFVVEPAYWTHPNHWLLAGFASETQYQKDKNTFSSKKAQGGAGTIYSVGSEHIGFYQNKGNLQTFDGTNMQGKQRAWKFGEFTGKDMGGITPYDHRKFIFSRGKDNHLRIQTQEIKATGHWHGSYPNARDAYDAQSKKHGSYKRITDNLRLKTITRGGFSDGPAFVKPQVSHFSAGYVPPL